MIPNILKTANPENMECVNPGEYLAETPPPPEEAKPPKEYNAMMAKISVTGMQPGHEYRSLKVQSIVVDEDNDIILFSLKDVNEKEFEIEIDFEEFFLYHQK